MSVSILECRQFSATYHQVKKVRVVKDYEIDLELGGDRLVYIDDVPHRICRGSVCIRRPGQTIYGQNTKTSITQNTILLTVDFSGEQSAERYTRNVNGPIQRAWELPLLEQLDSVVVPQSESAFIPLYRELLRLDFTDRKAAELLVMQLVYQLNAEVCRQNYVKNKPAQTPCSQVLGYLKANFDKAITLEELAQQVYLNKSYLVRLFKQTYGQTPIRMLIDLRMEYAFDLIVNTNMPVSQIAAACGYLAPSYFIAEYKKHFGITPAKQRNQLLEKKPPDAG